MSKCKINTVLHLMSWKHWNLVHGLCITAIIIVHGVNKALRLDMLHKTTNFSITTL